METLPKRWYQKKRYIIALVALGLFTLAAANSTPSPSPAQSAAISSAVAPIVQQQQTAPIQPTTQVQATQQVRLSNDNYYINSSGNEVHSPAYSPAIPPGATAQCRDGTYSFSQHRSGTCSHHGGVAEWF